VEPVHAAVDGATPVDDSFALRGPGLSNLQYAFVPRKWAICGRRSIQLLGARHRQHGGDQPLRHARAEDEWLKPLMDGEDPLGPS